jgi:prephenate dehydratase
MATALLEVVKYLVGQDGRNIQTSKQILSGPMALQEAVEALRNQTKHTLRDFRGNVSTIDSVHVYIRMDASQVKAVSDALKQVKYDVYESRKVANSYSVLRAKGSGEPVVVSEVSLELK